MQRCDESVCPNGMTMDGWETHSTRLGRAEVSKNMMPQYREQPGLNSGRPERDEDTVLWG
ncbi:MAG: hypothetical protein LUQ33_03725 [Methanoregulaceae archaeon]|nr:hypothetical protein [Methanoregulaceae archaeon]